MEGMNGREFRINLWKGINFCAMLKGKRAYIGEEEDRIPLEDEIRGDKHTHRTTQEIIGEHELQYNGSRCDY